VYITVEKFENRADAIGKLLPLINNEFIEILRDTPGFKIYCAFTSEDGHFVSVILFDEYKSAKRFMARDREWMRSTASHLMPHPPEVLEGEVLTCEILNNQPKWDGLFTIVHVYREMGPEESATLMMQDHIVPMLKDTPGFCGCYTFLELRSEGCGLSISVYDTREHAEDANQKVLNKARNGQIKPYQPIAILGQIATFAVAGADNEQDKRAERVGRRTQQSEAEKILSMVDDLYWEIRRGVRRVNDDAETELGKWVNILSYIVDNTIDESLPPVRAHDLLNRAELAIDVILLKPQGGLNLVREMRHEIILDVYRAEGKFSENLINLTNGSPSFTVFLGVTFASFLFCFLLLIIHLYPFLNVFTRMDRYFVDGAAALNGAAALKGSIEGAAVAAFAGGVVSVLTRLEQFEARRGVDPKLLFLNAISRPYIGAIMAMFVVAVQGLGLFSIADTKPDAKNFAFFLIVVGFLSGFSERFATDFIGNVEGGFAGRRASNRSGGSS
jgi:hypothetical protein